MEDISKYRWYQCDLILKNGKRDLWCRFIATSQQKAEEKIIKILRKTLTGSIKNKIYMVIAKRYVDDFDIFRVPEEILKR